MPLFMFNHFQRDILYIITSKIKIFFSTAETISQIMKQKLIGNYFGKHLINFPYKNVLLI